MKLHIKKLESRFTDSDNELMVTRVEEWGKGYKDSWGVWERYVHTAVFKTDNQQAWCPAGHGITKSQTRLSDQTELAESTRIYCTVQGTLLSITWHPRWEGSLGRMDTWVYMAESFC